MSSRANIMAYLNHQTISQIKDSITEILNCLMQLSLLNRSKFPSEMATSTELYNEE